MSYHTFQITDKDLPTLKMFLENTISSLDRYSADMDSELDTDHTDEKYKTVIGAIDSFQAHKVILQDVLEQISTAY